MEIRVGKVENCKITGELGIDLALAVASKMFQDWARDFDPRLSCNSIHFQSVDVVGKRVLFLKFKSEVYDAQGRGLPGIVFMRGGCVSILVILVEQETGIEYAAIVRQARVPIGRADMPEGPAGMLDGSNNLTGVAVLELQQELGISITADKLIDLTQHAFGNTYPGLYTTPGGSDEFVRIFLYRATVPGKVIHALEGKHRGEAHAGEFITTQVIPYKDLWRTIPNVTSLAGQKLYEMWLLTHPQT